MNRLADTLMNADLAMLQSAKIGVRISGLASSPSGRWLVNSPLGGTANVSTVVRMRRVEAFEVVDDELRERQLLVADGLHDALRELVAAVVVVVRVVDFAARRRERRAPISPARAPRKTACSSR